MLGWLRTLGRAKVGDGVEVISGPYAGRTGVIRRVEARAYQVFIDDCCQPMLEASRLRRLKRHGLTRAVRSARESDPISEEARAATEIRDWVDSVGP